VAHPSSSPLDVPYHPQVDDGYCLPACVQMVLAYLGLPSTQEHLTRELDVRPPLGAPASNVTRLRPDALDVTLAPGDLDDLRGCLARGDPPIVFVQAGEFPHWRGHVAQHAVVVVKADEESVHVLDPAATESPLPVPVDDFMLAWSEMECLYAVLTLKHDPPPVNGHSLP
jgi:ABC-type bacteriocin/lantibiotic exporter with double-glycine peptidase domain